jgi:hypothetical protein
MGGGFRQRAEGDPLLVAELQLRRQPRAVRTHDALLTPAPRTHLVVSSPARSVVVALVGDGPRCRGQRASQPTACSANTPSSGPWLSITRGQSLDAARVHVPGASVGGGAFVDEFAVVFGEGGDDAGEHPPGWGCSSRCL